MADLTTNTTDLLASAQTVLANTLNRANQSNLSTAVKDGLITSAGTIQSILDDVFRNNGIITNEQVNALDREIELAKIKILESRSNQTANSLALVLGVGVTVIGLLWYFTSEKN